MSSILNRYKKRDNLIKLSMDKYFDVALTMDKTKSSSIESGLVEDSLIAYLNTNESSCLSGCDFYSMSAYTWDEAIAEGDCFQNIGFTGIDNGLISYRKDMISNQDFYDILTISQYTIEEGDTRLHLHPITGNSGLYSYPYELVTESGETFYRLKGGFLQGFYKGDGINYQVLPNEIEDSWSLEFKLRPKDYETQDSIINKLHPENKGIFFYMGTRAENKFCQFYDCDLTIYPTREQSPYPPTSCDIMSGPSFFSEREVKPEEIKKATRRPRNVFGSANKESYLESYEYEQLDVTLHGADVNTEDGKEIFKNKYYKINTDNKYLFFNQTESGFTTKTWDPSYDIVLEGLSYEDKENLFLIMHQGESGKTVEDLKKERKESKDSYNILNDIYNNAFGFRITDDGKIGYKYLIQTCDESGKTNFEILEGYSKENIISKNEWNTINVNINLLKENVIRLYFYVNGDLKFISKELPNFNFRRLNDSSDKQESVPYNISLGGGTQGLCDSIWLEYYMAFPYILPIEENFGGTFIGDFSSFKFYKTALSFNEIQK